MREQSFFLDLLNRMDYLRQQQYTMKVTLGGSTGSGGGGGSGPGGFSGLLPQSRVAGDTTESFSATSGSVVDLLSNLNNIRAWLKPAHFFWADPTDPVSSQLQIATGIWFHDDSQTPLDFAQTNTPAITAPSTNPRYALLTVDKYGNLAWSYGAEAVSPTEPNPPSATSGSMPLWLIYERTSGSVIQRYNDSLSHYIYADRRPFLDWGVGGAGGGGVLDASSPLDVGSSASVGTSGSSSHGDHVHRGVHGVYVPSNALAYGDITLSGSGDVAVTQSSGSITVGASSGSFLPRVHDINGAYHTGFPLRVDNGGLGTTVAPTAGAIPIGTTGGVYAPNYLVAGSNVTITNSSGSVTISSTGGGSSTFDATNPQDVGASPVVGTSGSVPHGDHVHQGLHSLSFPSGSFVYGDAVLIPGANVTMSQSSGSITINSTATGGGVLDSTSPMDVGASAVVGTSGSAAHGDHAHRGVTSVSLQPSGAFAYGNVVFLAGTNISIAQSSGSLTINNTLGAGGVVFDTASPLDVGSVAVVGTSGSPPHADHVHRGVTGLFIVPNSDLFGSIQIVAGSNMTITQSSGSITFASAAGGSMDDMMAIAYAVAFG